MSAFEFAAIFGALAWIPQIYGFLVKPKLKIFAHREAEIGYSTFGPILNVRFALSASRKDAVVERMQIEVRHERGQSLNLTWKTLNETMSIMWTTLSGEAAEQTKSQPAIAVKVSPAALVEKLIGFQDETFQEEERSLENAVIDRRNRLRGIGEEHRDGTARSDEFSELLHYFERGFPWLEGSYQAVVTARVAGLRGTVRKQFAFALSSDDIQRLRANVSSVRTSLTEIIREVPAVERTPLSWNWAYPRFLPA